MMQRWLILAALLAGPAFAAAGERQFSARDTLKLDIPAGLIEKTGYAPAEFSLRLAEGDSTTPMLVRFASPRPGADDGEAANTVVLEWFAAEGEAAAVSRAPAVLVLHTIDPRLFIARGMARALARRGIHAFVMHGPGYGLRRYERYRSYGDGFFERSAQTVADARRARDAIASLPGIDAARISIQGTSLGGFWATAAASLDGIFDHTFIYLAGADLHGVLTRGVREAAWLRESIQRSGVDDARLRELCGTFEPLQLCARLDPARTWLFSAQLDQVVPADSAKALAAAVKLNAEHHIWLPGDHYTAIVQLPWVAGRIADVIVGAAAAPTGEPTSTAATD